jgi:hypothetical protein
MSSHEIVGINVAARKLVAIGERAVLEATGIYFFDLACALTVAGSR